MKHPIPAKALEQHIAVLGKTGSGKSYAVRGAVEGLLDTKQRVCVIDPTGAWSGLRSSASGKSAGYSVVIFGGSHADLPLGGAHGEAIAEVVGTSTTPCILDTALMKVGERTRFFTDFADAIVRKNKGPLHLVIDEAHLFMPQSRVNDPQSGAMMHAGNNMVSLGRSRGLRIILITQRPAKLHKDALTQAETLIAMRLIAPQDRAAVEAWIEDNADDAKAREIVSSLATLKTGQGWIWAPELNILERVTFPKIKTFDSGQAPDGTEASAKVLAPIDKSAISARLEAVSAAAVADDPKRLRARIADLERAARMTTQPVFPDPNQMEKEFRRGLKAGMSNAAERLKGLRGYLMEDIDRHIGDTIKEFSVLPSPAAVQTRTPVSVGKNPAKRSSLPLEAGRLASSPDLGKGGKRRMLIALAQFPEGMDARKLSILTDMSNGSGTWSNYMSELRKYGWIEGSDILKITRAGLDALGSYEPLPTGQALIDYWKGRLGSGGKRAIFDTVVSAYPDAVSIGDVAGKIGMSAGSGTWSNYLSELRGLGLIEGRGELRASDTLF